MSKLKVIFKRSYVFILLAAFYIPLMFAVVYSFNKTPSKGNMSTVFNPDSSGWGKLIGDIDIARGAFASFVIALVVSLIVIVLSLLTVFALWRSRSKMAKGYVSGTSNIPLINPDVITAISLSVAFTAMFGTLKFMDDGVERAIIGHATMILPFGITIMYPRSETFNQSQFEASKDLGYGPVKTWFKTYFRHMLGVLIAVFIIAMALSFDDFIITKTTSRVSTIGTKLYATQNVKPWIFALGTIVLAITISASLIAGAMTFFKSRKEKVK